MDQLDHPSPPHWTNHIVYLNRLLDAISDMKKVIMDSAQLLLLEDKSKYSPDAAVFDLVSLSFIYVCTFLNISNEIVCKLLSLL